MLCQFLSLRGRQKGVNTDRLIALRRHDQAALVLIGQRKRLFSEAGCGEREAPSRQSCRRSDPPSSIRLDIATQSSKNDS